ncbi:MAG: acyl-CoA reductase, partial [Dehalococcoidales bacterium]|nr:acyl-CoA reductase [Dehalococcoidales bacterium]
SAAVIKLPYGATAVGALLSLAAAAGAPDHPVTKSLSIVYWPGGEESIENVLFGPGSFDRIVIWGSPNAVSSVRSRTPFTKVSSFNPRYGVSLVGREAFENDIEAVAEHTARDVMIYNQKACTSSLVQYVEGTLEQAEHFARLLAAALEQHNIKAPGFTPPSATGQIKRMRRGKYAAGTWCINNYMGNYSSGTVVIPGEFDILDHPMCRLAIIRPVSSLDNALKYMSQNVSTAGVYPEDRRLELRDRILARGVSNVLPLGECGKAYPGMPHDGVLALNELVDWKIS